MMKISTLFFAAGLLVFAGCGGPKDQVVPPREIWTAEQANDWYQQQGWLIGPNYSPASAINQLEMWQEDTFDPEMMDKELGWAAGLGMNTARVYLHDLLYEQDSTGFIKRIDQFLDVAAKHGIRPMFVFFDSCWDPSPRVGKQREPKPHLHNSGWMQSPGKEVLADTTQHSRLERYVKGVITAFADDKRVLAWDVWNEPDNMNVPAYDASESPDKVAQVLPLLKKSFEWARAAHPSQPLTSGIWAGDWSADSLMKPIEQLQLEQSDVISFHNYASAEDFEKRVLQLQRYNKPLLCTEYMARPAGSTFAGSLPVAKKYNVAMYNWGFVSGKTQTIYPWDSWRKTYTAEPPLWFHDIFRGDGTPYLPEEVDFIREIVAGNR